MSTDSESIFMPSARTFYFHNGTAYDLYATINAVTRWNYEGTLIVGTAMRCLFLLDSLRFDHWVSDDTEWPHLTRHTRLLRTPEWFNLYGVRIGWNHEEGQEDPFQAPEAFGFDGAAPHQPGGEEVEEDVEDQENQDPWQNEFQLGGRFNPIVIEDDDELTISTADISDVSGLEDFVEEMGRWLDDAEL
jgi:hypothetical protein